MRRARWARVGVKASERPGARAGPSLQVHMDLLLLCTGPRRRVVQPVRSQSGRATARRRRAAWGGVGWRRVAFSGVGWRRVALGGVGLHWVASSGVGCRRRAREREEPKVGIGLP